MKVSKVYGSFSKAQGWRMANADLPSIGSESKLCGNLYICK